MTPSAKGARRLANVALAYLVTAGSDEAVAAAKRQYETAATMTDRIGGAILAHVVFNLVAVVATWPR